MRLSLPLLLIIALASALPVQAQPSPVVNVPTSAAEFLRSGGAEPDTTEAWRYFPLAVGNAWEYYNYFTGERRRVDVYGTETHDGRTYFSTINVGYGRHGESRAAPPGWALRYDTAAAAVWYYVEETDEERPFNDASCPLDAEFGAEVACYFGETFSVGGGYDGVLAFGEPFPGTGEDTVRTAVKTYLHDDTGIYYDYRYAAGIGLVFYEGIVVREGLYYARVDGVEHGVSVLPSFTVDAETEPLSPSRAGISALYPNPVRERLTLVFHRAESAPAVVEVVDVLGRVVRRRNLGVLPPGHHEVQLRTADLAAGPYLVRLVAGEALWETRIVTRLR